MAKRLKYNYTFTPSTNTLIVDGHVDQIRLLLVTNVTRGIIIYNFSDPSLGVSSAIYNSDTNKTTFVLEYNCSAMNAEDHIQIFAEDDNQYIEPSEVYTDPVNKFRTSTAQALIDTDFEYGTQITKWENLGMIANRPYAFSYSIPIAGITSVSMETGSRSVSIGFNTTAIPERFSPIFVYDTFLPIANGNFVVEQAFQNTAAGVGIITYTGRAVNTTGITSIFDTNKTGIYTGATFTNVAIGTAPSKFDISAGFAVTVTTPIAHGLSVGNEVAITNITGTNTPNGSFTVVSVATSNKFTIYSPGGVPSGLTTSSSRVFVRPQAQFLHRPVDGGVVFTNGGSGNYEQAVRQTRRYFRYQSGKGIQASSGTILKPNLQLDSLTASGTVVTVTTKEPHNILNIIPGTEIRIQGAIEAEYNGTFTVDSVTGFNQFTYIASSAPSKTAASGNYSMSVTKWYGAVNRLGIFDQQNGMFFEFDGVNLYAVRRSSTFQISGKITVTQGQNAVIQSSSSFPTYFAKQLAIGDSIVIRGQSYRIIEIASDTSMTITPSYRGSSASFAICSKTIDIKYPQSQWTLDKCDGTGPSGYNLDISKMQMFYIDYSWYGAGFIRYGFRGNNGNVFYAHKIPNNNVNYEAYMRSGNLPARYESSTEPPTSSITTSVTTADTYIGIGSTVGFPPSGTIKVGSTSFEFMNYTGVGTTALTGITREKTGYPTGIAMTTVLGSSKVSIAQTGNLQLGQRVLGHAFSDNTFVIAIGIGTMSISQSATASLTGVAQTVYPIGIGTIRSFTYSETNPTSVELAFPTFGPSISHWGTSVIMDGRFDDDKSLVFTYGQERASSTVSPGASRALFAIRVAPSVDNGIAAGFGQRELTNRMQLVLRTLDITVNGGVSANANLLVRTYLNSIPSIGVTWTNAVGNVPNQANSSFAQIADYPFGVGAGTTVSVNGGEVVAGFFVGSGANSIELDRVRDLGNSIQGGGGHPVVGAAATSASGIYPDGPDTLTIVVTNVGSGIATVSGRLSWTEAQA